MTDEQQALIDRCKAAGFGWRKFAESVERSGQCSTKQHDALIGMIQRLDTFQMRLPSGGRYKNDITDCEIMSFGLHI
jgi:hypothetical protein